MNSSFAAVKFTIQKMQQKINIDLGLEHVHDRRAFILKLKQCLNIDFSLFHFNAHEFSFHDEKSTVLRWADLENYILQLRLWQTIDVQKNSLLLQLQSRVFQRHFGLQLSMVVGHLLQGVPRAVKIDSYIESILFLKYLTSYLPFASVEIRHTAFDILGVVFHLISVVLVLLFQQLFRRLQSFQLFGSQRSIFSLVAQISRHCRHNALVVVFS